MKMNAVVLLVLALPTLAFSASRSASDGLFTIETTGAPTVKVVGTSAVQKGDKLIVAGKVQSTSNLPRKWIAEGHIDVNLNDSNGETLYETTVGYSPKVFSRKTKSKKSSFTLTMPVVAPAGSVLNLSFHSKAHSKI